MKTEIRTYIISLFEKKHGKIANTDLSDSINYVEKGFVDSIGLMKFIVDIENKYNIELSNKEITDPLFRTIGGLIEIIEQKIRQ